MVCHCVPFHHVLIEVLLEPNFVAGQLLHAIVYYLPHIIVGFFLLDNKGFMTPIFAAQAFE